MKITQTKEENCTIVGTDYDCIGASGMVNLKCVEFYHLPNSDYLSPKEGAVTVFKTSISPNPVVSKFELSLQLDVESKVPSVYFLADGRELSNMYNEQKLHKGFYQIPFIFTKCFCWYLLYKNKYGTPFDYP